MTPIEKAARAEYRPDKADLAIIDLVSRYGGGLDLRYGIGAAPKRIARNLINHGYLAGTLKSLYLTAKGQAILPTKPTE
jgi:hypothetical protein